MHKDCDKGLIMLGVYHWHEDDKLELSVFIVFYSLFKHTYSNYIKDECQEQDMGPIFREESE